MERQRSTRHSTEKGRDGRLTDTQTDKQTAWLRTVEGDVAATKGRSGSAMTVRRRHGTGMGKSDATAERRRREGRTDNGARREREGERERDGHKRDKARDWLFIAVGAVSITVSHFAAARRRLLPSSSLPSRRPLRIYTTSAQNSDCHILTTHHSLSIHPLLPHLISFSHCLHHSVLPLQQHHHPLCSCHTYPSLSTNHETDRFVLLSSRRAGIDCKTLCCINW
jgi:hypothetical protein